MKKQPKYRGPCDLRYFEEFYTLVASQSYHMRGAHSPSPKGTNNHNNNRHTQQTQRTHKVPIKEIKREQVRN